MADKRFARVSNDPRFKKIPRKHRKVKIDSRFKRMFTDKTFTTKYFVDKRGAASGKTTKEDLHQFYDLSDEENDENSTLEPRQETTIKESMSKGKDEAIKIREIKSKKLPKGSKRTSSSSKGSIKNKQSQDKDVIDNDDSSNNDDNNDQSSDEQDSDNDVHVASIDLARGEGNLESSSDDDSDDDNDDDSDDDNDSDNEAQNSKQKINIKSNGNENKISSYDQNSTDEEDTDDKDEEIDHQWAELDSNVQKSSDTTRRLAICHLDWDRINAHDLFVVFSSLKTKGVVKSVKIYPSEFGLTRLKNEECYGPEELIKQKDRNDNDSNVEGEEFSQEKLRQYQINRLKYYYAVVECDCAETANDVYSEFDGVEFELSGNLFDLRFIPDDMEFEHEPTSVATQMPTQAMYKPPEFETTALHQTNVKLTWDETDNNRVKTTMRAFNKDELQDMDFEAYLASSSDEEETRYPGLDEGDSSDENFEDEEQKIAKYKSLVQEIDAKEHEDDNDNEMEITWEPGLKESAEDLVAKKKAEKREKTLTPWERYLNKKKEKRKEKRANEKQQNQKEEHLSDEEDDDIPEGVDMSDPFFSQNFGPDFPAVQDKQTKTNTKRKKNPVKHGKETEEDKKQKEELELLLMDENDDRQHFNLKRIMENEKKKKKRKKRRKDDEKKEDTFSVNVDDSRFTALYSSHLYAIDPSDPQFKDTKAMGAILEERQRRRTKNQNKDEKIKTKRAAQSTDQRPVKDPSLSLLVNSVKSKTGVFNQRKMKRKHTHS